MMSKLKYIFFTIVLLVLSANIAFAQIPDNVIFSLKKGNAEKLSSHFTNNVELVILDKENVYSKAHAQQVLSDFFKKYPPENFTIIHQGGKDGANYAIGNLKVKSETFRVYFLIKKKNGASYIHQLRIEKQV